MSCLNINNDFKQNKIIRFEQTPKKGHVTVSEVQGWPSSRQISRQYFNLMNVMTGYCKIVAFFSHKTEQTARRKMRRKKKKNQLTPAPGVLNAHRHNLYSGHNMTQRTGAPLTQERYVIRGFDS